MSPDEEPRRPPMWVIVAVVAVAVLLIGSFVWIAARSLTRRMESAKLLDQAIELTADADRTVLGVDAVVRGKLSAERADKARELLPRVALATTQLEKAVALTDESYLALNDNERKKSTALKEAATARLEMLSAGAPLLQATVQAQSALEPSKEAYDALVQAEKDTDAAVQQYNKLNKDGATASQRLNVKAKRGLMQAEKSFAEAEQAFPAAEMDAYQIYITARLELVSLSLQSDAALIAGNEPLANTFSQRFNEAERTSAKAARSLPESPEGIIAEAYDVQTKIDMTRYLAARNRASDADRRLRRP